MSLVDRLKNPMRDLDLFMQVSHDLADGVGWRKVLEKQTNFVSSVQFRDTSPSVDFTPRDPRQEAVLKDASSLTVKIDFEPESATARLLSKLFGGGKQATRQELAEQLGGILEVDKYDEGSVSLVTDGHERKLRVDGRPTRFVYHLDVVDDPDEMTFLNLTIDAAKDTLLEMGVSLTSEWWPTLR